MLPDTVYDDIVSYTVSGNTYYVKDIFQGAGHRLRVGVFDNAGNYSTIDIPLNAYCNNPGSEYNYAVVAN